MYLFHFCCIPFSAKDCYYYFYFYHCMTLVSLSIFWSIYFYKFMCVLVCCSSNDCYFCDCVIAFLLLLLRVFSSSFDDVCCRNIESNTQKSQNIQQSILFSSQCFLFGERVLYVVVVRVVFVIFCFKKNPTKQTNLVITGVKCSFSD